MNSGFRTQCVPSYRLLTEEQIKEMEAQLDTETLVEYRRLTKLKGELALAACESGTCSVCFTGQTPQTWNELLMGRVVYCSSCGAILYKP